MADGCKKCVKGEKLVLFITGLCGQKCFYCPVSEKKFGQDVIYANEWKIEDPNNPKELIEEAKLTNATGAGITGGDPLVKTERCVKYITLLKKTFGKQFHIHLYTPLQLITKERLQQLYKAGLDEIRFHPNLDNKEWWPRLKIANNFKWDIGIEIPAVPGKEDQTKELIDFAAPLIQFINFNELEQSDTTLAHYNLSQYPRKDDISYGVKGSKEMAMQMMNYANTKKLRSYFCTAKLKDGVQMKQRIKRRAKNVALDTDVITEEGLLLRGCVYLEDLSPGVGYRKLLESAPIKETLIKLKKAREEISLFLPVSIDKKKLRLLCNSKELRKQSSKIKKKGFIPAIVEEYPTQDA